MLEKVWWQSFWKSANNLLNCRLRAKSTTMQLWMQPWRIWLILLTFPCCLILSLMAAFFLDGCSLVYTQKQKYEKQTTHTGAKERAMLFSLPILKRLFIVQFFNYLSQYPTYVFISGHHPDAEPECQKLTSQFPWDKSWNFQCLREHTQDDESLNYTHASFPLNVLTFQSKQRGLRIQLSGSAFT